jgi:hypothetical protein
MDGEERKEGKGKGGGQNEGRVGSGSVNEKQIQTGRKRQTVWGYGPWRGRRKGIQRRNQKWYQMPPNTLLAGYRHCFAALHRVPPLKLMNQCVEVMVMMTGKTVKLMELFFLSGLSAPPGC